MKYLGEFQTEEYSNISKPEWMMKYIETYGGFDGSHHKAWVIDQVARIYHGTPVIVKEARWEKEDSGDIHTEIRFNTGEPSQEYLNWVKEMRGNYDEEYDEYEYEYDEGIAP